LSTPPPGGGVNGGGKRQQFHWRQVFAGKLRWLNVRKKDDKSSRLLSTTNYSQVDPDFPTKPTEEESDGSSTGAWSLQGNSDGSPLEKSDDNSSHLSSTTNYSQVDPDFPIGSYK
jgi:hypothetical protein